MNVLKIKDDKFILNGKEIIIISGSIHYFRVVPEYWKDRLLKLKACGFNAVEFYIPWNLHEPNEGEFCFEGIANVEGFLSLVKELDLIAYVRPSPYICAEWEFGGLPAWLLKDADMNLRCYDQKYLEKVDNYYDVLIPKLVPFLSTNGGPIVAVQVENEYGSYGNDKKYLEYIKNGLIKRGIDVILFTSDGPVDSMLQGGTLPDVLMTVNMGSGIEERFEKLKEYQKNKPLMCMEYWNGWFDHWGEEHKSRAAKDAAKVLDDILKIGASVNFYMFHGGTNFGFYNGANSFSTYEPAITSYDYDCLLNEYGEPTEKYYEVKKVISKYKKIDDSMMPDPVKTRGYGKVKLHKSAELFNSLDKISTPILSTCTKTMEQLGQNYGFILYSTFVKCPKTERKLILQDVHDRALVFLDAKFMGTIDRNHKEDTTSTEKWNKQFGLTMEIPGKGALLQVLVENMGRINYGPYLKDRKGITECIRFDNQILFDWTIHCLPLNNLGKLEYENATKYSTPGFYKGTFEVDKAYDTFLRLDGFEKGVAYINGFNLGRYWSIGPQKTLYIPAPLLKRGVNDIIIFELHGTRELFVSLEGEHILS